MVLLAGIDLFQIEEALSLMWSRLFLVAGLTLFFLLPSLLICLWWLWTFLSSLSSFDVLLLLSLCVVGNVCLDLVREDSVRANAKLDQEMGVA